MTTHDDTIVEVPSAEKYDGKATAHQRYIGQTSYQLTEEEWNMLEDMLIVDGPKNKLMAALRTVGKTATGAQQLREILGSNRRLPLIIINNHGDRTLDCIESLGAYSATNNILLLHTEKFDDLETMGSITLHELLHARQSRETVPESNHTNKILMDAETQALSLQLAAEREPQPNDQDNCIAYRLTYQRNCEKWYQKSLQTQTNFPDDETHRAWAQDMASKETRAQFIKDWIRNPNSEEHALAQPGYEHRARRYFYRRTSAESKNPTFMPPEVIDNLIEQYHPFLRREDFNFLRQENRAINREKNRQSGTPRENSHLTREQRREKENRESIECIDSYLSKGNNGVIAKALPIIRQKLLAGKELTPEEKAIKTFVHAKEHKTMPRDEKIARMSAAIGMHQTATYNPYTPNARYTIRDEMIDELSIFKTGRKGQLEYVYNEVPEETLDTVLCGTLDTHSRENITAQPTSDRDQQIPGRTSDGAVLS